MCAFATRRTWPWLAVGLVLAGCKINVGTVEVHLVHTAVVSDDPLAPATVPKIRVRVEGDGMAPREAVVGRGSGGGRGVLSDVPLGNNRIVIVEGLNAFETPVSRGVSAPFTMNEGTTHVYLYISLLNQFSGPPADSDPAFGARYSVRMRRSEADQGRAFHTATRLPDGTVLVSGGVTKFEADGDPLAPVGASYALRTAERFDPTAGAFLREGEGATCDAAIDRLCQRSKRAFHAATLLESAGLVMLVGGEPPGDPHTGYLDPLDLRFRDGPDLVTGRSRLGAALVPGELGGLFVAGGVNGAGEVLGSVERFDLAAGSFAELPLGASLDPRVSPAVVGFAEGLVVIGGWQQWPAVQPSSRVDVIRVKDGGYVYEPFEMNRPRAGPSATLVQDGSRARVLVCGGLIDDSTPTSDCEMLKIDPGEPEALPAGDNFKLFYARWGHSATRLQDGRVLVAGGFSSTSKPPAALPWYVLIDPEIGTTHLTALRLKSPRGGHSASLLDNGMVVLVGGLGSNGDMPAHDYEIFNP